MPIYEYRCPACRKRTSVFVRSMTAPDTAACEHCGSTEATRVFSRVAVLRGDEGFSEASLGDIDESDPRSVAKWVRKMSREMGEPLDGDMQSELERMEAGEMPENDDADGDSLFNDVD
ncbi:MAG: zinc ribbon domain-containing protein [Chloroflexota bacterium]|mgnify:CR=1 FL=1